MRILHINDVAHVGTTLVEGLNLLGHDAELRPLRLVAGQRSTIVKLLVSPLRLRELALVNRQVRRGSYDVVHIHFAYLGWLGISGRYPYYLHCHGSDIRRDLRDPLRHWPILQSLQRAKIVLYVTPDIGKIIHTYRPDSLFLPNPVNTERFRPLSRGREGSPKLLLISRLSQIKGVNTAFAAIESLIRKYPEIKVTAIRSGPEQDQYLGTIGVTFISPVSYSQMPELINSHDIVIGQFHLGILSMAELESMSCGKPVISYFKYNESYLEPPPVFSSNNPEQIADFLSTLIENRNLRLERGDQSREWIHQHHGFQTIAHRLVDIYNS